MPSLKVNLRPSALAEALRLAAPAVRAVAIDGIVARALVLLGKYGPPRDGGESATVQLKVVLTASRHRELLRAADALRVPPSVIVRDAVHLANLESERDALELEYRRRGGPGEPSRLGLATLRWWLADSRPDDTTSVVVRELIETVVVLTKAVEKISSRIESVKLRPSPADVLQMGERELRAYLRRLGGRAPRTATRSDLMSLIRKKEQESSS
jgi:predicted nucleic acid-binding protein